MSTYLVFGVEEVYDAFDEYEHANPLPPFSIEAHSIDDAKSKGADAIWYYVQETRKTKGFFSSGDFVPRVIQIADESGQLVYDEPGQLVRVWPFESDETYLIPSDGLPTRVCFLSYSSRDQEFAQVLFAGLRTRHYMIWFAPKRPDMPKVRIEENDLLKSKITEGIRTARLVLVAISTQSVTSDWVAFEVSTAIEGEESHGRPAIIGLQIEPVASQVPWLSQLRARYPIHDLSQWYDGVWLEEQIESLMREMDRIFDVGSK